MAELRAWGQVYQNASANRFPWADVHAAIVVSNAAGVALFRQSYRLGDLNWRPHETTLSCALRHKIPGLHKHLRGETNFNVVLSIQGASSRPSDTFQLLGDRLGHAMTMKE